MKAGFFCKDYCIIKIVLISLRITIGLTMKRAILFLLLMAVAAVSLNAQYTREKMSEKDGFVWYRIHPSENYSLFGAEDSNGRTIIPLEKNYSSILYSYNSIGCFYVKKDGYEGAYSKTGKELISTDRHYDYVILYTDGYFGVKRNGKKGACDLSGREVVPTRYSDLILSSGVYKTKDSNGRWIPISDAQVTSGVQASGEDRGIPSDQAYTSSTTASDPTGPVSRTKRQNSTDKYEWYNTRSGNYEGAEDIYGNTLIPLSRRYEDILYSGGVFYVKKGGYEGICDRSGRVLVEPKYFREVLYVEGVCKYKDANGKWTPIPESYLSTTSTTSPSTSPSTNSTTYSY